MLNDKDGIPLYLQLYHEILEHIVSGEWPAYYKVPSEAALCSEYEVSRMTVRLALEKLKDQGYIKRKQGQGSYVSAPAMEQKLNAFYSFSDVKGERGGQVSSKVLSMAITPAKESIAAKLEIALGTEVFCVERIRQIEGRPFVYENSYIPVSLCPQLTKEDIEEHGLYKSLLRLGHISLESALETFEAISMDSVSAKYLNIKSGQPAMLIERIAKQGEQPVEFCISTVKGDRMKYNILLHK